MMIRTVDGDYLNTDQMRNLSSRWNAEKSVYDVLYEYADGHAGQDCVHTTEWEQFEHDASGVITVPAEPGYFLLTFYPPDEHHKDDGIVDRWPVLAWELDRELGFHRVFTPWTHPSEHDDQNKYDAILCPGGRVVDPGSSAWPDEQSWLDDCKEKAAKAATEKAAQKAKTIEVDVSKC